MSNSLQHLSGASPNILQSGQVKLRPNNGVREGRGCLVIMTVAVGLMNLDAAFTQLYPSALLITPHYTSIPSPGAAGYFQIWDLAASQLLHCLLEGCFVLPL